MRITFATQAYKLKATAASMQRCLNFYAEREPPEDAKDPVIVWGSPGLSQLGTVGNGPIRGQRVLGSLMYVVSGDSLYSVDSTYTPTLRGTGIDGGGVISMSDNGTQIIIVNGTQGFIYNTSTAVFSQITSANFFAANTVTFIDGYFLLERIGTTKVFFSVINDGTTFNALDFFTANVDASLVKGVVNQQQNVLVFKEKIIETWYDSGDVNNPFQRFNGATIERGCAASMSILKEDNSVFFLGNDRIAYRLDMPIPHRISTPPIEQEWQTYATVSDCVTTKVTFEGHKWIHYTFPTANTTWVYDIETGLWHERQSYAANAVSLGRWRGNTSEVFQNKVVIGDAFSNQLGQLSSTTYSEYGFQIIGQLISPPIHSDRKRTFLDVFELDMETGVGLQSGQGSNPQVMLDWSKDGGRTFSNFQQWKSLGKIGQYLTRLRWTRLGQARQWVLRVTISDPVRRAVISASAENSKGDA